MPPAIPPMTAPTIEPSVFVLVLSFLIVAQPEKLVPAKAISNKSETVLINKKSLQEIVDSYEEVDLLKIDVEGYEKKLINSEIDISNVNNVLIECHPNKKKSYKIVLKNLKRNGFELKYRQNGTEKDEFNEKELFIVRGYKM